MKTVTFFIRMLLFFLSAWILYKVQNKVGDATLIFFFLSLYLVDFFTKTIEPTLEQIFIFIQKRKEYREDFKSIRINLTWFLYYILTGEYVSAPEELSIDGVIESSKKVSKMIKWNEDIIDSNLREILLDKKKRKYLFSFFDNLVLENKGYKRKDKILEEYEKEIRRFKRCVSVSGTKILIENNEKVKAIKYIRENFLKDIFNIWKKLSKYE